VANRSWHICCEITKRSRAGSRSGLFGSGGAVPSSRADERARTARSNAVLRPDARSGADVGAVAGEQGRQG
jgi:hypothetical protein